MYPVTDLPRAVAFYRDVLGFAQNDDLLQGERWAEFQVGATTFGVGNFEQAGKPGTAQSLAVNVADMQTTRSELSGRGIESPDPFETPVCLISVIHDPDGNQIWLHQPKKR
jgi:predicted enzyme related to lactoylglutathione lyase